MNKNLAKLAIFWEDNAILTQTDLYPQLSNEHAKAMFVEIVAGRLGSLGMTIASEKNKNHIHLDRRADCGAFAWWRNHWRHQWGSSGRVSDLETCADPSICFSFSENTKKYTKSSFILLMFIRFYQHAVY